MPVGEIIQGNCIDVMRGMEAGSVDAIVTDPPYGLKFMNSHWDCEVPGVETWKECLRVLKPGGHLLSFFGTRTYHRGAVNIEDAGFEIRDMISWVYGSGFPKSLNVGKAVDKLQGNEREVIGTEKIDVGMQSGSLHTGRSSKIVEREVTKGNSEWEGWGTALKPAFEPVVLARKPISEKTIVENVLKHRTGGLNIDGCRVATTDKEHEQLNNNRKSNRTIREGAVAKGYGMKPEGLKDTEQSPLGRYPSNFIHDGSDEVVELFPETISAKVKSNKESYNNSHSNTNFLKGKSTTENQHGDSGSAARFFYCAKATRKERELGCDGMGVKQTTGGGGGIGDYLGDVNSASGKYGSEKAPSRNHHPTVKPIELMRYLCRLITPKGGVVLDPFAGSGSTGCGAVLEGFRFIGIERESEYCEIAKARLKYWEEHYEKLSCQVGMF